MVAGQNRVFGVGRVASCVTAILAGGLAAWSQPRARLSRVGM
jgi:hypothetical protein